MVVNVGGDTFFPALFQVFEFGEIQNLSKNNSSKNTVVLIVLLFIFCFSFQSFSQTISTTGSSTVTCGDCTPNGWSNTGGTPDISNSLNVGGQGTIGGGASWVNGTLPKPPTGGNGAFQDTWITMRDVGDFNTQQEESVTTIMGGLVNGKYYKLTIYFMTAPTNLNASGEIYSPQYTDAFDYQMGTNPRQKIPVISSAHDKWVKSDYVFKSNINGNLD